MEIMDGLTPDQHREILDEFKILYEKTENPVFAWEAYHYVRGLIKEKYDFTIPEWILAYFDEAAYKLNTLYTKIIKNRAASKRNKKISTDIAISLNMSPDGGQGNIFTQALQAYFEFCVNQSIETAERRDHKRTKEEIYDDMARLWLFEAKMIDPKRAEKKYHTLAERITKWHSKKE